MKKTGKIIFKILGAILGVLIIGIVALLIIGPKDPIVLTPEQEAQDRANQIKQYANVDLSGFNTRTITGQPVTSDYFKDYDITMINLWTTSCGPCIDEMPEIAGLYRNRPKKSSIISICIGTENNKKDIDFAEKVMKNANADFLTLIPDEKLKKALTDNVRIFPTTIFVDSNGKVVGEPHFGDRTSEDYRKAILDRMALLKNKK